MGNRSAISAIPFLSFLLVAFAGCAVHGPFSAYGTISPEIAERTSHEVPCVPPTQTMLPVGVVLEDGIDEDEAIATAIANNSAFQATIAQLSAVGGDVVQASLLTNPNFSTMLPVGVKQWEWTLFVPMEAFLLQPHRVAAAEDEYRRLADQLVQNGLDLVRDVRVAHADWVGARDRLKVAEDAVEIREGVRLLTERRLERGDISELETMTARIDKLNAEADLALRRQDFAVAQYRITFLMGLPSPMRDIYPASSEPSLDLPIDEAALVAHALRSRPDIAAAQWAVSAAERRLEIAHWTFLRFDAGADYNHRGDKGAEIGPAFRFDIPIFNRNEGGILRAEADLVRVQHERDAVRERIVQEVRTAVSQYRQSTTTLSIVRSESLPALDEAQEIAAKGFDGGGLSYLLVLQTTTQYLDAKLREADQLAAIRRSVAELERSVGRSLTDAGTPSPPLLNPSADP
jgi:cobalt-zinc-cadmium efflux system outer membrane protein